ncbi:UDP-N-acetylmuramate--L-alanine ligase [Patescibacteria group bacterium]|nr:UDP-N-acetylmuramate--L-alanine ligase [Patescibacteria group bacterium]
MRRIHMIGIGGIGMSALAQFYFLNGESVSGSDREASPTTELLEKKGLRVHIGHNASNIPEGTELVVYSDAVWPDTPERLRATELGIPQISYFEALGEETRGRTTLAVTGTHGKTTTTAMLAHILREAGKQPTAVVGSIVQDFGSNFLAGDLNLFVVEGCEYKDHVLKLSPKILVLTNAEWDHTDWFPTFEAMQGMFRKAILAVPADGAIITNVNHPNIAPLLTDVRARVIDYTKENAPKLTLEGEFNKMNARAAKAAAKAYAPDISDETIDTALSKFRGTWRRFEYKGVAESGAIVYDDYGHHPTAIKATLEALRAKHPDKKISLVFHPHLYTRTRDLFNEFVEELSRSDKVILVPIYPAREEPIPGVTSDALASAIAKKNKNVLALHSFEEIEAELRKTASPEDVIMTIGAGDIYKVADNLVRSPKK